MAATEKTGDLLRELDTIDTREDDILDTLLERGSRLQRIVDGAEQRSRTVTVGDLSAVKESLGNAETVIDELQGRIERAVVAAVPANNGGPASPTPAPTFDQIAAGLRERNAEADRLRAMLRERLTALEPNESVVPRETLVPGAEQSPGAPRTFMLKSKPMRGADIKRFQRVLNKRFAKARIGIRIREDGRYTPQTALATRRVARILGISPADLEHGVTPRLRVLIRKPKGRRTPEQLKRARQMRPWVARLRKRYPMSARRPKPGNTHVPRPVKPGGSARTGLAAAIDAGGGRYGRIIVREAKRSKLSVPLVCAVVDVESNFRNVFGHDGGPGHTNPIKSPQGGTLLVTKERYDRYVHHRDLGRGHQGVGPMQLTFGPWQDEAQKLGGCWKEEFNIHVGVKELAGLIRQHGEREGLRRYNAGASGGHEYPGIVLKAKRRWVMELAGAAATPTPKPGHTTKPKPGQPRTFRLQRKAMQGRDVAAFQRALNRWYAGRKIRRRVVVDGRYGPDTRNAARQVLRGLGVNSTDYEHGITPRLRSLVHGSRPRSARQRQRARHRRPWVARLRKRYAGRGHGDKRKRAPESSAGVVRPLATPAGSRSEFGVADAEGAPANNGTDRHAAKDWFAPGGSAVEAPVAGKVVEAKPSRGNTGQVFGGTVKIQGADGKVWVFRHVDPKVSVGKRVSAGERVATVTAWRGGSSHAHIEVWKTLSGGYDFENMLDPMKFFGKWA